MWSAGFMVEEWRRRGREVNVAGDSDGQRAPFSDPRVNDFLGILSTFP